MDVHEIKAVGEGFEAYLAEFSDCFGRCDTALYLGIYVEGQHSGLQRKRPSRSRCGRRFRHDPCRFSWRRRVGTKSGW